MRLVRKEARSPASSQRLCITSAVIPEAVLLSAYVEFNPPGQCKAITAFALGWKCRDTCPPECYIKCGGVFIPRGMVLWTDGFPGSQLPAGTLAGHVKWHGSSGTAVIKILFSVLRSQAIRTECCDERK